MIQKIQTFLIDSYELCMFFYYLIITASVQQKYHLVRDYMY